MFGSERGSTISMTTNEAEAQRSTLLVQEVSVQLKKPFASGMRSKSAPRLDGISLQLLAGESVGVLGSVSDGSKLLIDLISGRLAPTAGNVFVRPQSCLLEAPTTAELKQSLFETLERIAMAQDVNGRSLKRAVARTVKQAGLDEEQLGMPLSELDASVIDLARLSAAINASPAVLMATSSVAAGHSLVREPGNVWFERYLARGGSALVFGDNTRTMIHICSRIIWIHEGRVLMDKPAIEVHRAQIGLAKIGDDKALAARYLRRYQQHYVPPQFLVV